MFERIRMISAAFAVFSAGVTAATAQEVAFPEKCKMSGGMAAQHEQMMKNHDMSAMKADYQKEFMEGMHKTMPLMMEGMMKEDADVAFVCGMIPHHQGAIDMARVVLKTGDNAEARKMAETVIKAQEQEIAEMKDWLKKNARKEGGQ